jgi:hypothetical protein
MSSIVPCGDGSRTAGSSRAVRSTTQPRGPALTTGRSRLRRVTGLFAERADRILHISVAGAVIQVTPEHPFYSPDKGWTDAGHLRKSDRLLVRDGRHLTVK